MTVSSVLREATAAAIEDALRNCGAYTGTAYEDGSFCFDGDVDPKDLADAVLAALQLTEEWKTVHESGGGQIYDDYSSARRFLDNFVERPPGVEDPVSGKYTHIDVRFVGPWRATQ